MIFVDSNIIINAFTKNKDQEKCKEALRKEFLTDALCLVEAQRGIAKIRKNEVFAANCIRALFSRGIIISLDRNVIFNAIRKIGQTSLNFFDLIHYVVALRENCKAIVSYDMDFNDLEIMRETP